MPGQDGSRQLRWVASSRKDFMSFPKAVQRALGYALRQAQDGDKPPNAKPLKGSLRDVVEITAGDESGTFRVMYTTSIGTVVCVLDAFQKKSKTGIKTSLFDQHRTLDRLKRAQVDFENGTAW